MASTTGKVGYADHAKIPGNGNRHEIIEGQEFMTPPSDVPHQLTSRKLVRVLDEHVTQHRLGEVLHAPVDVVLSPEDIVQPDVVFVAAARSTIVTEKNIQGAPDLVVEILSPSTAAIDRGEKLRLYERSGVRECWLVDPRARTVEIRELASPRRVRVYQESQRFESALLPGLVVDVGSIF